MKNAGFTFMSYVSNYGFAIKRYAFSPEGTLMVNHQVFIVDQKDDGVHYEKISDVDSVGSLSALLDDMNKEVKHYVEFEDIISQALQMMLGNGETKTNGEDA